MKQKTFFFVSRVLSFRRKKQISKNEADATFKQNYTSESYLLPSGVSFSEFLFPGIGLLERALPCGLVAVNTGLFPRSRDLERGVLRPFSGG